MAPLDRSDSWEGAQKKKKQWAWYPWLSQSLCGLTQISFLGLSITICEMEEMDQMIGRSPYRIS